ncbi:MAG: glycosyltransferase family 9 protein [Rhodocyclaceae bacterium]
MTGKVTVAAGDILLIYRKQLGDLVLLQPAIQHLAERYGRAIQVRTRPGFADLLDLMPGHVRLADGRGAKISDVFCFDTKLSSVADALRVFPARRNLLLTRAAERGWWWPLMFQKIWRADGRQDYRAKVFFRAVGGDVFQPPRLTPPPPAWMPTDLPERYLVVHPTSAWRRKTWPAASWVALLSRLVPALDCPVVITAGTEPWEQEMAGAIARGLPTDGARLAGKTSLRAYLAVLSRAQAVLTVDGSASHLASAFGRRTLTLFGPTNPVHWHHPTRRSRRLWAGDFLQERKPAVGAIPVEAALAVTEELLEEPADG